MSTEYICDGCGKRAQGEYKPSHWYARTDKTGTYHACSRECIDRIAREKGQTRVVLPW